MYTLPSLWVWCYLFSATNSAKMWVLLIFLEFRFKIDTNSLKKTDYYSYFSFFHFYFSKSAVFSKQHIFKLRGHNDHLFLFLLDHGGINMCLPDYPDVTCHLVIIDSRQHLCLLPFLPNKSESVLREGEGRLDLVYALQKSHWSLMIWRSISCPPCLVSSTPCIGAGEILLLLPPSMTNKGCVRHVQATRKIVSPPDHPRTIEHIEKGNKTNINLFLLDMKMEGHILASYTKLPMKHGFLFCLCSRGKGFLDLFLKFINDELILLIIFISVGISELSLAFLLNSLKKACSMYNFHCQQTISHEFYHFRLGFFSKFKFDPRPQFTNQKLVLQPTQTTAATSSGLQKRKGGVTCQTPKSKNQNFKYGAQINEAHKSEFASSFSILVTISKKKKKIEIEVVQNKLFDICEWFGQACWPKTKATCTHCLHFGYGLLAEITLSHPPLWFNSRQYNEKDSFIIFSSGNPGSNRVQGVTYICYLKQVTRYKHMQKMLIIK
ncbi:putative signal peptide protein [Puccinia sorghi]|uniref:Putative signal peptide protein n=1 Tax=Puccinia sorghi TaxID=27349 RepID=A0A0L6VRN8_9BASI|nr:putative signal peptide protein [Puccinia sorghi]